MKPQPVKHFENHSFRKPTQKTAQAQNKNHQKPPQASKGMKQQGIFIWEIYLSLFCYKQSLTLLYKCSISCKVNSTSLQRFT